MPPKPRTALVIIVSSAIISSVLAFTAFAFYAYLEWKEANMRKNYRFSLYEMNGRLFRKYIAVDLTAEIDEKGPFRGSPVLAGTIKNKSDKTIYSLNLKVAFYDHKNRALYVDKFYPIGREVEARKFLFEGDSVTFTRRLDNCPPELLDYLSAKLSFAKAEHVGEIRLAHEIEGMEIR